MFLNVELVNLTHIGSADDELYWWRKSEVQERAYIAQAQVLDHPGRTAYLRSRDGIHKAGVWVTLEALWHLEGKPAQQRSLLKAGLLFALTGSSRKLTRCDWLPPYQKLVELQEQFKSETGLEQLPWRHVHTDVLPYLDNGRYLVTPGFYYNTKLKSMPNFLAELDRLVTRVMQEWQPVRIRYAATQADADRLLAAFNASPAKLAADQAIERRKAEFDQVAAAQALIHKENEEKLQALRQKHPRFDEWPLPNKELKALIWAQPVSTVAKLFGISDTAIRKHCDRHGIERPPQGYWLRKEVVSPSV